MIFISIAASGCVVQPRVEQSDVVGSWVHDSSTLELKADGTFWFENVPSNLTLPDGARPESILDSPPIDGSGHWETESSPEIDADGVSLQLVLSIEDGPRSGTRWSLFARHLGSEVELGAVLEIESPTFYWFRQ